MTAKRDFKRRVRARQQRTGESYTTARRHVSAQAPADVAAPDAEDDAPVAEDSGPVANEAGEAISVIEMISLTEEAQKLGYRCRVTMASTLAARVEPARVLDRVIAAVHATATDVQMENLRGVVLRGERPIYPERMSGDWLGEYRRFVARTVAGIGGISDNGNMMALSIDGVMVIAHVGLRPSIGKVPSGEPRIVLNDVDSMVGSSKNQNWYMLRLY